MKILVKVRCTGCGATETIEGPQDDLPTCPTCLLPMEALSAETKEDE
jgi:hypothetical protein